MNKELKRKEGKVKRKRGGLFDVKGIKILDCGELKERR